MASQKKAKTGGIKMRYQKLGKSEIEISAMGLGCMGFTHAEGAAIDKKESVRLIREAVDMGYFFRAGLLAVPAMRSWSERR